MTMYLDTTLLPDQTDTGIDWDLSPSSGSRQSRTIDLIDSKNLVIRQPINKKKWVAHPPKKNSMDQLTLYSNLNTVNDHLNLGLIQYSGLSFKKLYYQFSLLVVFHWKSARKQLRYQSFNDGKLKTRSAMYIAVFFC